MSKRITFGAAVIVAAMNVSAASAGGFTYGDADIYILLEDGRVVTRDSATFVDPNRKYDKKPGLPGLSPALDGREFSDSYWVPSLAAKIGITDEFSCAATYTVSFGGASDNRGVMDSRGKLKESFTTDEYGLTCAYHMPVGPGRLSLIGGVFYSDFNYDLSAMTFVAPGVLSPMKVDLGDGDFGWRAGVAYDIPEIAFRTSLVYRSGTSYSADGDARFTNLGMAVPAAGWGELPQSIELKVQSGIAEDWLAFGALKWTDWSVMDRLHLRFGPSDFYNEYHWRDGITVTGGVAHSFNETFAGFASVTWDRGVSTGWDLYGDTVAFAVGTNIKDKFGGELQLTAAAAWLAPEQETQYGPLSASSQSSWGYGLRAQYKISF
ncbi:outer membrane protein transport protein [Pararhizobium sp. BT-229]|uniref:outer membrane protein transport protein n=1 Tax=Pararhizobium sp. BT-229 TaxID=2986923 RepID=UPI0021F76555|nr:outer membrane protein transport protein [Pararhizobium sp. BT-229]MCV9964451.1 outer membrane protein transport protein [Pararhizobium sp. BT-229]